MKYWEIWNEPDLGGQMWCGDYDQFAKFFAIVCKRLKTEFPQANIAAVDYDPGASEVNQLNRIKLMLSAAKEKL